MSISGSLHDLATGPGQASERELASRRPASPTRRRATDPARLALIAAQIADGSYDTPQRLSAAIDRLWPTLIATDAD